VEVAVAAVTFGDDVTGESRMSSNMMRLAASATNNSQHSADEVEMADSQKLQQLQKWNHQLYRQTSF
jgi:hypothetical protein